MEQWTAEEYNRYIKLGIKPGEGKIEQKKATKAKKVLEKTDLFKANTSTPKTLFPLDDNIVLKDNKEFVEIELWLSGEPLAKQSYRNSTQKFKTAGYHKCPWTGNSIQHQAGDVFVYRNTKSNKVDVINIAYIDKKYTDRTKEYKLMIQDQLPKDFVMFTEEVHILELKYIFQPLVSFSKKLLQQIEDGNIIKYKTSKPDAIDNCFKIAGDAMSELVYKDDALIVHLSKMNKIYGINPGIYIKLRGK